jgi:hypothetical protein
MNHSEDDVRPMAAPGDLTGRRMERQSPLLEEAWRYWSSLRTGLAPPPREALDPRAMSLILGHSMILERRQPGAVRVRVGGRVMDRLMGMDVRGLPVRAFFETAQRARAIDLIERVFDEPATLELDLACAGLSETRDGRHVDARLLVLPLRDGTGAVSRALSCIAVTGLDIAQPRRFAILRERLAPIRRADPLPREIAPPPGRPGPRPWLRVIK